MSEERSRRVRFMAIRLGVARAIIPVPNPPWPPVCVYRCGVLICALLCWASDDGDIGWVKDLEDEALVRMLDGEGPAAEAPPLMAAVATSVDAHAHGEKGDIVGDAAALVEPPTGAVSFSQEPTVKLPAAAEDGEP